MPISGHSSVLLIGKNGSGKTTVALALEILQSIARGTSRVGDLVKPKDFARGRSDVPMRFEIEVELDSKIYEYVVAFTFPSGSRELRVFEEKLAVGGRPVYTREAALMQWQRIATREEQPRIGQSRKLIDSLQSPIQPRIAPPIEVRQNEEAFRLDWHLLALPIIQEESTNDPLFIFRQWLARMLVLRPMPSLIQGDSKQETLEPKSNLTDFGAWFSGLLTHWPAAYAQIDEYLKQVMPDLKDIQNPVIGADSRSLVVQFSNDQGSLRLPFEDLSDGEKSFMICALVLAANNAYGPLLCFWDEPDNYLALSEVGHFVLALRKAFQSGGQFIATSHNPEAIRRFSDENTLVLYRKSHLEPTIVRPLSEIQVSGDLVNALIRGDVEP